MNIKEFGQYYEVSRVACLWRINERKGCGTDNEGWVCAETWRDGVNARSCDIRFGC